MLPDIKHIILANMNVKQYSWPLAFREVMWQRIWKEVAVLIPASSMNFIFANNRPSLSANQKPTV